MMIRAIVHKEGNRTLLEISSGSSELEEYEDGQEIQLAIVTEAPIEISDERFDEMIDRMIAENRDALTYLAQ